MNFGHSKMVLVPRFFSKIGFRFFPQRTTSRVKTAELTDSLDPLRSKSGQACAFVRYANQVSWRKPAKSLYRFFLLSRQKPYLFDGF